jgi:Trypsin-like peptidase domain
MATGVNAIDEMYFRVAKIRTFVGGRALTNATGFFYLHDEFLYLVTARHVVISETAEHRPDRLQLSLHSDAANLQQRSELSIPLYVDGVPQWYQHPQHGGGVDVVAVAVNDPHVLSDHFVVTFCRDDILNRDEGLPLGQDVLILGFPLGFSDTLNNLPIVRSATIASSFSHPFKGEPYFLTDGRLHRGMSGSPVIVKSPGRLDAVSQRVPGWKLLGIHTSALDVSDRDPLQDERLALNTTWYASLIPEMLPARTEPNIGSDRKCEPRRSEALRIG